MTKQTTSRLSVAKGPRTQIMGFYLRGQGDLVSGLIMGIIGHTIWVIGAFNLLTKSP